MRHLATIQRITSLTPIKDADRIELAHVLGWQCVVKKGQFEEGDLCVYYEIDSFLPAREVYRFLANGSWQQNHKGDKGYRLKTQKFRGEISQGLILPLHDVLADYSSILANALRLKAIAEPETLIGCDVTDLLGVTKWEVPEMATTGGTTIGDISSIGVPHTDETRIQAEPGLLKEFEGVPFYITTKMDGSSHSCAITEDGAFHVTGHNYEYRDDGTCSMYELAKRLNVEENMRAYMEKHSLTTLTLQGELCSPGIQKNKLGLKEPHWYVFTVIEDGKRVGYHETCRACEEMRIEMVPIEEVGEDLTERYPDIDALLLRAGGNICHVYPGTPEGIVIRPIEIRYSEILRGPLSMKIINNKYLLKAKD